MTRRTVILVFLIALLQAPRAAHGQRLMERTGDQRFVAHEIASGDCYSVIGIGRASCFAIARDSTPSEPSARALHNVGKSTGWNYALIGAVLGGGVAAIATKSSFNDCKRGDSWTCEISYGFKIGIGGVFGGVLGLTIYKAIKE